MIVQVIATQTVANANNWARHLIPLRIDKVEQISRMVVPCRIIAKIVLVENATLALLCYICDPNASDTESVGR